MLSSSDASGAVDLQAFGGLDLGRQYAHAPIKQAIVELRLTTPEDLSIRRLEAISFGDDYAMARPIFRGSAEILLDEDDGTPQIGRVSQNQTGFSFERSDEARAVQVGPEFFTFIWKGEYTSWDEFIGEAESLWTPFREFSSPLSVEHIGVRFVNVIPIPARPIEIRDYLRLSIDIPAALPQILTNWFTQIDIPMPNQDASATITTGINEPDFHGRGAGLLLDIDVKTTKKLATISETFDGELRDSLDSLRLAKNLVFEACITDATRDRIDRWQD